jgi:hypothetical protein
VCEAQDAAAAIINVQSPTTAVFCGFCVHEEGGEVGLKETSKRAKHTGTIVTGVKFFLFLSSFSSSPGRYQ